MGARWAAVAGIAIVLAGACGSAVIQPTPTPTAPATATSTATASPTAQPSPSAGPLLDRAVVYFARDRLPPVARHVDGAGVGTTREARILSRLEALFRADAPAGLANIAPGTAARPAGVRVIGDLATIDFTVPGGDWGTAGSAGTRAFVQQLVYTASEEPGIRRVLITENGHDAIIGGEGLVIDQPVAREDVAGYQFNASTSPVELLTEPRLAVVDLSARFSVDDYAPALVRFVIDTGLRGASAKESLAFRASARENDERRSPEHGKWVLTVDVPWARTSANAVQVVERTPLRAIYTSQVEGAVRYELVLDDLRPWRVAMLYEPLRLVVDVGGDPDAVTSNIAVYAPTFGDVVAPGFTASGLIRAFEAQYEWRVVAYDGSRVAGGFARASLGTSELWGTFELEVPAVPRNGGVLEILLRSPRDGSVSESVAVPLSTAR